MQRAPRILRALPRHRIRRRSTAPPISPNSGHGALPVHYRKQGDPTDQGLKPRASPGTARSGSPGPARRPPTPIRIRPRPAAAPRCLRLVQRQQVVGHEQQHPEQRRPGQQQGLQPTHTGRGQILVAPSRSRHGYQRFPNPGCLPGLPGGDGCRSAHRRPGRAGRRLSPPAVWVRPLPARGGVPRPRAGRRGGFAGAAPTAR
jgi:hypothetical protein